MYPYDYVIIWRDRSVITYPYNCYWKIWQNIPQPYYISCSKTYSIFVVSFGLLLVRDGPLGATLGQDVLTAKEILNILCLNCYSMLFLLLATARVLLLRLCRSFCGCPQRGAAPYRDCFLDLRLFNSPDLRRVGLCYCCQAWTLETVLGGNTALTRWWTARSIDADAKR